MEYGLSIWKGMERAEDCGLVHISKQHIIFYQLQKKRLLIMVISR